MTPIKRIRRRARSTCRRVAGGLQCTHGCGGCRQCQFVSRCEAAIIIRCRNRHSQSSSSSFQFRAFVLWIDVSGGGKGGGMGLFATFKSAEMQIFSPSRLAGRRAGRQARRLHAAGGGGISGRSALLRPNRRPRPAAEKIMRNCQFREEFTLPCAPPPASFPTRRKGAPLFTFSGVGESKKLEAVSTKPRHSGSIPIMSGCCPRSAGGEGETNHLPCCEGRRSVGRGLPTLTRGIRVGTWNTFFCFHLQGKERVFNVNHKEENRSAAH